MTRDRHSRKSCDESPSSHTSYTEEYRKRAYVRAVDWAFVGHVIGLFIPIVHLFAGIIGLSASIRHIRDSRQRIKGLKEQLNLTDRPGA